MTERINHVAEARAALEGAGDGRNFATDASAAALAHATLALVEQQRIANLIAYVQLLETQYAAARQHSEDFDWSTHQASLDRHAAALGAIREGLGL